MTVEWDLIRNHPPAAETHAQLGHVYVIDPGAETAEQFQALLAAQIAGEDFDPLGELARTVYTPLPTDQKLNGGCWVEGFTRHQIPHTHQDDGQKASERYILLIPKGGDGYVDIAPKDGNGEVERFVFPQDHISLLHFDGGCAHRFSIGGDDPDAILLAFATHTRDVATTSDALLAQTDVLEEPMGSANEENTFPPPDKIESYAGTDQLKAHIRNAHQGFNSGSAETVPYGVRSLAEVTMAVYRHGTAFGAEEFADVRSYAEWLDTAYERALPPRDSGREPIKPPPSYQP